MFTQMYILDAILLFHSTLTSQESMFLYLLVSEMLEIREISKFPNTIEKRGRHYFANGTHGPVSFN